MSSRNNFLSLVKGLIIGISSLISSLSSGSVMASLSFYHNFIDGVNNIFKKNNKKFYLFVMPCLIGIIAGLLGGPHVINYFLSNFYNHTIVLFIGLLIGGFIINYRNPNIKFNIKNILIFLFSFILVIILYFVLSNYLNFILPSSIIIRFLIGLLMGLTILIPGIPISSYMVSLNKYDYIKELVLDFNFNNVITLILFVFGIIIGIILASKLLYYLFNKYNSFISILYLGLILSSIVILIINFKSITFSFSYLFTLLLSFLWGYILAIKLEDENDK